MGRNFRWMGLFEVDFLGFMFFRGVGESGWTFFMFWVRCEEESMVRSFVGGVDRMKNFLCGRWGLDIVCSSIEKAKMREVVFR